MKKIYPVIMCGGAGTRLWPLSRQKKAKQYHALVTNHTMLQETVLRMNTAGAHDVRAPSFVCAQKDEKFIKQQCQEIGSDIYRIILEPVGRNTAPLAAIVSDIFGDIESDALVLLLPADHHIADPDNFWRCVEKGAKTARNGNLVTLGIKPDRAETGFGYIKRGQSVDEDVYMVDAFVEKPNVKIAEQYVSSGDYFWNAGIFLFTPATMKRSFVEHAPDILEACKKTLKSSKQAGNTLLLDEAGFSACPPDSLDYAIMEKAQNVALVAPVDIGWSDIGSWSELADLAQRLKNVPSENAHQLALDCEGTFFKSDGPFIAGVGLKNMIVIAEGGAVLIIPKDRAQDVKRIVEHLKERGRDDLL